MTKSIIEFKMEPINEFIHMETVKVDENSCRMRYYDAYYGVLVGKTKK